MDAEVIRELNDVLNAKAESKAADQLGGMEMFKARVVANGQATYVMRDGSATRIPVSVSVANVSYDSEVLVMVVSGEAFIIGNASQVAASVDDVADVQRQVDEIGETFYTNSDGAHVEGEKYRNDLNSNGMTIVDKLTNSVLARFAKDLIELGNSSTKAVISLLGGLGTMELNAERDKPWLRIRANYLYLQGTKRTRLGNPLGKTTVYGLFQNENANGSIKSTASGGYGSITIPLTGGNREYICVRQVFFDSRAFALLGWYLSGDYVLEDPSITINYRNVGSSSYSTDVHAVVLYQDTGVD